MPEAPEDLSFSELVDELDGFSAGLKGLWASSQAALAIFTSQIVENILEGSLRSELTISSKPFDDRLFKNYGPLSTFSAKIDLAHALDIVDEETYNTLRILKSIRNKVAHPADLDTLPNFDSPAIVKECRKLPGYVDEKNCFKQFLLVVASTIIRIDDSEAVKGLAEGIKGIDSEQKSSA